MNIVVMGIDEITLEQWKTNIVLTKEVIPRIGETISLFNEKLNRYIDIEVADVRYIIDKISRDITRVEIKGYYDTDDMPY